MSRQLCPTCTPQNAAESAYEGRHSHKLAAPPLDRTPLIRRTLCLVFQLQRQPSEDHDVQACSRAHKKVVADVALDLRLAEGAAGQCTRRRVEGSLLAHRGRHLSTRISGQVVGEGYSLGGLPVRSVNGTITDSANACDCLSR